MSGINIDFLKKIKLKTTGDYTVGSPMKHLLGFAFPVLFGYVLQQLYNLVDTKIVGATLGETALAAVGATASLSFLIIGFATGMANGMGIVVAKYFGAEKFDDMRKTIGCSYVVTVAISILLTTLSCASAKPLLRLLDTPDEIIAMSAEYITVIFAGILFTMFFNLFAALLRAMGNPVAPIMFLLLSTVINIVLDYAFILVFGMGVGGAGYATVAAQFISALACFFYAAKTNPYLKPVKSDFKFRFGKVKEILATGTTMGFLESIVAIGSISLQAAINGLGLVTITAHTVARKIDEMLMMPFSAIAAALATFVSQNFGAAKYERIRKGIIDAAFLALIWSALALFVTFTLGRILLAWLATTDNADVISTAFYYLKINIPFFLALGLMLPARESMPGIGKKAAPLLASLIECAGKVIIAFGLTPKFEYTAVCFSEPILWTLSAITVGAMFWFYTVKLIKSNKKPLSEITDCKRTVNSFS